MLALSGCHSAQQLALVFSWHQCSVPLRYHCQLLCFSSALAVPSSLWITVSTRGVLMEWPSDCTSCLAGMLMLEGVAGLVWGLELCTLQTYLSCLVGRNFELNCAPWKAFFSVHSKRKYKLQSVSSRSEWTRVWTWRCILGGVIWQRECIPQYSLRKSGNRQVPHSGLGSTNRSCGSCWCHSYFALCKLKPSKQELKCGSSKWPQQKNQRDNHRTFCWWHVCNSSRQFPIKTCFPASSEQD